MSRRISAFRNGLLVGALVVSGLGCGGGYHYALQGTQRAAGADATIDANINNDEGNTRLEIRAVNLPPPDRIQPGMINFVVWQRRNANLPWTRIGSLLFNTTSRIGELHGATVPERSFELQISAEPGPTPTQPSSSVVFFQAIGG